MFEFSSASRNMNFKSTGDGLPPDGSGGGRTPVNFPLFREPSIYSLTFGEFQNSIGGNLGKDFGSMNMDEFLKNIWTAEETQATAASTFGGADLQRQGSLTLPRTLSQKTVDEVWRDLFNENSTSKDWNSNGGSSTLQQRQQTLGEMTLEEFLARAGVVRDDTQQSAGRTNGVVDNRILESNNPIPCQSPNLAINLNGIRSSQQPQQQQQQLLLPRPTTVAYATPVHLANNGQLASQGIRGTIMGIGDSRMNNGLVQGGGMGLVGLGAGAVATGSPANQISSDAFGKSNGDKSSLSPVPFIFTGGPRGRRSGAVEKVVERRQRRMIKNRESAARSRARKQAYTMELEAEVAKLKEENEELQKKQEKVMEIQKIQVLEMMNQQQGAKKRCLRRTQTDPW